MQHKIIVLNLNLGFRNSTGTTRSETPKNIVEDHIKPLLKTYNYTIEATDTDTNNPVVIVTLKKLPASQETPPIGQVKFPFSDKNNQKNVVAECSNFVVAKLLNPKPGDTENFTEITPAEANYAEAWERFKQTQASIKDNASLCVTLAQDKQGKTKTPLQKSFFSFGLVEDESAYRTGTTEPQKCVAIIDQLAEELELSMPDGAKISKEELAARTEVLNCLNQFLILYKNGSQPNQKHIADFRAAIGELESAGSPGLRKGSAWTMGISGPIGSASLVMFILAAVSVIPPITVLATVLLAVGAAVGLFTFAVATRLYVAEIPEGTAANLFLLADKMETNASRLDPDAPPSPENVINETDQRNPSQNPMFAPPPPSSVEVKYAGLFETLKTACEGINNGAYEHLSQGLKQVLEERPTRANDIGKSLDIIKETKDVDMRVISLAEICKVDIKELDNLPKPKG